MKIVSDNDLYISTLGGTAVRLAAGVPREVSETIGLLALQQGARDCNNAAPQQPAETVVPEEPIELEVTEELEIVEQSTGADTQLVEVLERLIELGNPEDFKADGTPKAAVVNRAAGRTVRTDEREVAWEIALNS